jgi:hypothetical protein
MSGTPESTSADFGGASEHGYSYTSTDWRQVWGASRLVFGRVFNGLDDNAKPNSFFNVTAGKLKSLYGVAKGMSEREDRLWTVRENLKSLSVEELSALMQVETVRGQLWTGAHVIAERNQQNADHGVDHFDRNARRRKILENVETIQKLGYSAEQVKDIYSHKKVWLTFTPHPTKDKNDEGSRLYKQQAAYADMQRPQDREYAMAHLIKDMLDTDITPRGKDSLEKETEDGLKAQTTYNRGIIDYYEDLQAAFDTTYGVGAIDMLSEDFHMDVAARKWHGGDADGKPIPATVLFNQRVDDSIHALRNYIQILESVGNSGGKNSELMAEPIAAFRQIQTALEKISARGTQIRDAGSTSQDFIDAQEEFVQAFTGITYKGQQYDNGPALTAEVFKDLRTIASDPESAGNVHSAAWRVAFLQKQNGIAMGRTELRHNAKDYNAIFDNLYTYIKANHPEVIREKVAKLSDLDAEGQRVLLKRLMERHGDQMDEWLTAANKDGWNREILERFRMVRKCYNHNRMGTAIIAEADAASAVKQQVLAEAFGIKNMLHVALNEDQDTIKQAAENLAEYTKVFGSWNAEVRKANGNGEDIFFCIMDPQSDSQKEYGMFIKGRQRTTKENLIGLAMNIKKAVYDKIGTGASYGRGGFSPKAVARLFINILGGREGNENDNAEGEEKKSILRRMASFVSTTIQGRDAGLRVGTGRQAYDLIAGIDNETTAACMAVDGKTPAEIVAPKPVHYSPAMEAAIERIRQSQCDRYTSELRGKCSKIEGRLDEKRIDLYLEQVAAMKVSEATNTGARKDTRKEGEKKTLAKTRAIGTNIAITNSETYFDGSYTLGYFLRDLHTEYKAGRITKSDLKDFLSDDFYMKQVFPNAFAALASADYEHGFDQLTSGQGHKWNVGVLQQTMKANYNRMNENLAFHTVLANDALHATAYMEALMNIDDGGFDGSHDEIVSKLYKADDSVRALKFGDKTRAFYPDIEQLQEFSSEKRLSRAIIHEIEERIRLHATNPEDPQGLNPDDPNVKAMLHHIATAHRNKGPINMNNLQDQPGTAFGREEKPVMDRIRAHHFPPEPPVNDASPDRAAA